MIKEYELVMLAAIAKKTELQVLRINELLEEELDWERVAGFIFQNRLAGYFFYGLNDIQKNYLAAEFYKTLNLICKIQKEITMESANYYSEIFNDFEKAGIRYCALKGLVYNVTMYEPGARRSNDADILVIEEDLSKLDKIFREKGFIQCFSKNGYKEATRKEKLIQRMNYHDLVPYVKKVDGTYIEELKFDINFHLDSKENDITKKSIEFGTTYVKNQLYDVRILSKEMQLAHLCIHFYREATEKIWTSKRRDVTLYKVVDIFNTMVEYGDKFNYMDWIELMKQYNIHKQAYFTLCAVEKFYDAKYLRIPLDELRQRCDFNEEELVKMNKMVLGFYNEALNSVYSINFENIVV